MSSGRIMIVGDKDAKKLLVRAPDEIYDQIFALVETLDQPSERMKLKRFQLRYSDAATTVELLNNTMADYAQQAKGTGDEIDMDAFTAMPDTRTNSITVVGSEKSFLFVEEILAAIDVETPADQRKDFRIFMLERADAVTVADAINSFAAGGGIPGGGGGRSGGRRGGGRRGGGAVSGPRELSVNAVPEETTNSVMVFGRPEDIDIVEVAIIQNLEDSISGWKVIEEIAVQNVEPSQIVSFIWQFIDQGATPQRGSGRSGSRGRGGRGTLMEQGGPQIVPNDSAKTLVVRGTPRQVDEVRELVARFDSPDFMVPTVKVVEIPYGQDAVRLAGEVERIINESESAAEERTGRRARQITIGADEYTNTLIVAGDPTSFGLVESIVKQLGEIRSDDVVTRVIQFRNLSAEEAEQLINDLNQQRGGSSTGRSSGTRRRSSSPSRSPSRRRGGGSRRGSGRRGQVLPEEMPEWLKEPLMKQPVALLKPYISVGPFASVVDVLWTGGDDDEEEPPVEEPAPPKRRPSYNRLAQLQETQQEILDDLERDAPGLQPGEVAEGLTGVSGALKGEVTARAVDAQQIIITGDADDVDFIEQILLMMEGQASPAVIEVFQMSNATATALAPIIEKAIQSRIEVTGGTGRQTKFSINAEGRSNSLIVAATAEIMEQIRELVGRLDVEDVADAPAMRMIPLVHVRAAEAVPTLRSYIEEISKIRKIPPESQATVRAIERSNTVLLVGTPKDLEEIEELVKTIDVELTEEQKEASFMRADVIIVQLKNAQAEDVAKVLTDMIEEQQQAALKSDGQKAGDAFVKVLRLRMADGRELPELNLDRPIKIIPEKGTNSLIVFSSEDNNTALIEIINVFDTLPIGADTDVKAFALKHAAAEEVAQLIEEIFKNKEYLLRPSEGGSGGLDKGRLPPVPPGVAAKGLPYPLVVQSDARSNTVFVIGRQDAVVLAGGLISELDRPTLDLGVRAYVLELKDMPAAELADKLDKLLDDRAKALGGDKNEARDNAVIQPDERSNSLIIFATEEVYEMIEDLVLQLDAARKYDIVDLRYRPLQYADAVKLKGMLEEIFKNKEAAEKDIHKELKDKLFVLADTRSNSLLLTGTRDYLAEAEDLIGQLDREFAGTVVFRVLNVRLNTAANIAALLQEMIDKALKQQDSKLSGTPIHVAADPVSDSLLIAAAREDLDMVERWIEILDRPSEIGRMIRIIPLRQAVADEVAKTVGDIFKQTGGQKGGQIDVTVTADPKTNSVVVFGPPALLTDIEGFVRELDGTVPGGGAMVRIFKLEQAGAEEAGDLITRILEGSSGSVGGRGGGGGGGRGETGNQVMVYFQREHPDLGVETLRAMREEIVVISDIRTNSLVVTAPPESMPLMESLVAAVDQPPDAAKIRVFRLKNADAEQMVEMLEKLFERETVGTRGGGAGDDQERMLAIGEGLGGRQEIAFTTDIRTNSVIAAGTPGYLDLVEEMILEIDTIPIEERVTFVYAPRNIGAEELAASLREFSQEEQTRLDEIGDEVSLARRQERKIVAISNEESNRIIFDVDPRFRSAVMDVVRELDQPPPQVMIQVLIIEVTMDNELDLGVEFAFQDLQYAKAGPTDTNTFDYVGGTDIGAAGSGLGGFTFTITGADFNFLFRTLQNEGHLQVLSRPQIVAMDNQEAYIDISDDVPYVTGTSTTTGGVISTSVARERIGIKLTVTPQINPDGFVRMDITQEVSDFTGSTVDIGAGVTAPTFFRREAKTVVMVKDNETVVLGGLITSRSENREQKVPILGDIPGLGWLFRNQNDTSRRTELLVVLTPHVVREVREYRDLSLVERDRMSVIPMDMLTDPLLQGLRMAPEELSALEPGPGVADLILRETPSEEAEEPDHETYGPLRPALRPDQPESETNPNSYDVPLTSRGRRRL